MVTRKLNENIAQEINKHCFYEEETWKVSKEELSKEENCHHGKTLRPD